MLILLTGGARSGKSRLAVELASSWGRPVVFIATGEARDEEMSARIARHREQRPATWTTVEEPVALDDAIGSAPEDASVLIDCLTLWVSNLLERSISDDEVVARARKCAELAAARSSGVVVVTNEVGSGIVASTKLGRRFADVLGSVNAIWADAADRAVLVVAGRVAPLEGAEVLFDG
jgi:adenosyl cobinamide kinase/adenosyl cobinamide phosphate guanylyltransferase